MSDCSRRRASVTYGASVVNSLKRLRGASWAKWGRLGLTAKLDVRGVHVAACRDGRVDTGDQRGQNDERENGDRCPVVLKEGAGAGPPLDARNRPDHLGSKLHLSLLHRAEDRADTLGPDDDSNREERAQQE